MANKDACGSQRIILAMILGALFGYALRHVSASLLPFQNVVMNHFLPLIGDLFISLIKMLIVPVVIFSIICGCSSLCKTRSFGKVALLTGFLYMITTIIAISLALFVAHVFHVGEGGAMSLSVQETIPNSDLSFVSMVKNLVPQNPFLAMVEGHLLQIIFFSALVGWAIGVHGKKNASLAMVVNEANELFLFLVVQIMQLAPIGVFALIAVVFFKQGLGIIVHLLVYFGAVITALFMQGAFVYGVILYFFANINPLFFYRQMFSPMLFAFSVSSSSASIPIVLEAVQKKLQVPASVAKFIVPMGATINMDGTAIMQGVATVFIAHIYHIILGWSDYVSVVVMATVASIGTAGVPGVGLLMLATVLRQIHVPVEGIALILGVDRLLDMARTAINIAGDAMVSCVVATRLKLE